LILTTNLEPTSVCVFLMCCKKQLSAPRRWRRHSPHGVGKKVTRLQKKRALIVG